MVRSTTPIKYAVPAGSTHTRLLTALAARYTGCTVREWEVLDGLDTPPASQNSDRFGYSFGKTRTIDFPIVNALQATLDGPSDVFITKLNPAGSALIYSTYLGGSGVDIGMDIS